VSESAPAARILVASAGGGDLVERLRASAAWRLEVFADLSLARSALPGVDAWVVDGGLGREAVLAWVEAARASGGGPGLVVSGEGGDAFALAAFRAGASAVCASTRECPDALDRLLSQARQRRHGLAARTVAPDPFDRITRDIIETMNSAVWVVDSDARIRFANPTAGAIVGMEPAALSDLPVTHFFRDRPREEVPILQAIDHGVRLRGTETVLTRDDGRVVPIGLSCAPWVRPEGGRGAVVIFQDLTEIKQLEQQVLQAEKMASIGQLAAGVAHEINNPMGFIHANLCQLTEYTGDLGRVWEKVEALRKAARAERIDPTALHRAASDFDAVVDEVDAGFLLEDLGKAIRESLDGSERIRAIVQDLRAFSHQDTAERVDTDVNKALDSTANIVWTMMRHSVKLVKDYAEVPPVSAFPVPLKQVFMNLLVNAYQAIEERAALDVEHRGEIRLRTEVADGGVRITVTDNGSGIAPDIVPRIFDPFFTTKEVGVGTGLGLSTSYNLIERHGGRLDVESTPGVGSTFRVWVPIEAPS